MVARNESIIQGVTKEQWVSKDIVTCIFDENDEECNLKSGAISDLAMVRLCFSTQNFRGPKQAKRAEVATEL